MSRNRRNMYIGSWKETEWKEIPFPFTTENLKTVLNEGVNWQISQYTHQDIANWCSQFYTVEYLSDKPYHPDRKKTFEIMEDVFVQWDLSLVNTYSLEELQNLDFSTFTLPVEWFEKWLKKLE